MTQKYLMFIAVGAYLFAILLMLRNGFGNQAGIEFGFVIFLVIGTLSAVIGNVMNTESRSE
jgi:ABC-type branched-subunit amino acid transport system permease subunit